MSTNLSLSFVLRCYNNFHQRQNATNISVFLSQSETLHCENKLAKELTKSKSLFELFKERVIVNFGDYFCCILIFSAKLLICSQTFVNLKYVQKLEISYEFDVRFIFTPMYGGRICPACFTDCTKHASAAALNHRQQTLHWLFTQTKLSSIYSNKPIVTYTCIGP